MDKTSSVIAAFEAGKLPSTQQFNSFIEWLSDVGITQVEPTALSSQGRVIADDLRQILDAYKKLANNKNADNVLQQAIWHLTQGDLTLTSEAQAGKDKAIADIDAIRSALRNLLSIIWSNISSEGTSLFQDILSLLRLSIADAAEVIEEQASHAKEGLRSVDKEVQQGQRDPLGREKKRLEEEKDTKVAWQHGMDTIKDAGTTVISASQETSAVAQEKASRTSSRLQEAYYKISDRAQSDPQYRQSLDTLFDILQKRLNKTMDAASDPNVTLSSFIADPTPEQHIPKALDLLRTLVERLAGAPLEPLIQKTRTCASSVLKDTELKGWFDDFFSSARQNLSEPGYARSEEARNKRRELRMRWRTLLEKDDKWRKAVDNVKIELRKIEAGLKMSEDLNRVRDAHEKFGRDMEEKLVEVRTGVQAAIEQATWFWQDLFKVYVPRVLSKMRNVPIPRTEYKDDEIEFVLENLDISSFNILPSHVYIRNITDVDILTSDSPSAPSRTAVGTLTHVRMQAIQLTLNDVSFWYRDKTASAITPNEFTGLLGLTLPTKGINVDLKVHSRASLKHFHVIEKATVSISEDVNIEVKESNHSVLMTLFKPIMVMRLKDALEKTLSEELRGVVEWADAVAWDVAKRREVFEDTGLGGGGSLMAALWSELGRLQRERREEGESVGWRATGTGVVVEQQKGEGKGKTAFAVGAEPQILEGEKRGPLGTGSERLKDKIEREMDVDASVLEGRAKDLVKEGKRQVEGFRKSVERKKDQELAQEGWQSASFDF
ncbi:hypothetical protein BYT27DRAFT_7227880 [Phlegmacium glaucopus]|nr:hypothetical protein BYT27DRAFT_7227880 [Phlegmacium glaucopus]